MTDLDFIKAEWQKLIAEVEGADDAASQKCLVEIVEHYEQPHRRYHNLAHLCAMFRDFYACYDHLENPSQVRAAILYHDIVYRVAADVQPGENEYVSSKVAAKRLDQLGFDEPFIAAVERMILATADHQVPQHTYSDLPYFLDMDMAILGSDPAKYTSYRDAVRAEYARYPDHSFGKGRAELFLKPTLAQKDIFHTSYFHERCDEKARRNMRAEIKFWEAKLEPTGLKSHKPK